MAQTYYETDVTSDLSVAGANANNKLLTTTSTPNTLAIGMGKGLTSFLHMWTEPGVPGASGSTGDYTVTMNVAIGASSANVSAQLERVSSSGTVQTSSSVSAEQSCTAGIKTFNWTALNLGAWSSGDRLRLKFNFINLAAHATDSTTIGLNTADEYVLTPWTILGPKPFAQAVLI